MPEKSQESEETKQRMEEQRPESEEVVQQLRTKEPQAPFGGDAPNPTVVSDKTSDEMGGGEAAEPGIAGYADRDPASDMPRMPSAPDSQDEA